MASGRTKLLAAVAGGVIALGMGGVACSAPDEAAPASDTAGASQFGDGLADVALDDFQRSTDTQVTDAKDDAAPVGGQAPQDGGQAAPDQGQQGKQGHHRRWRLVARRVMHGQLTVRTKDGFHQVSVQRGTITSVNGSSVTLDSPDHFTHAYTVDDGSKVRVDKQPAGADKLANGQRAFVVTVPDNENLVKVLVAVTPKPGS